MSCNVIRSLLWSAERERERAFRLPTGTVSRNLESERRWEIVLSVDRNGRYANLEPVPDN